MSEAELKAELNAMIGAKLFDVTVEDDEVQFALEKGGEQTFLYVSESNVMIVRKHDQPVDDDQMSLLEEGAWPWCESCKSYHHPKNESCETTK